MVALRELRSQLNQITRERLRSASLASRLMNALFVAAAAALAGVAQFWTWPDGSSPSIAQILGIAGTGVVFLAASIRVLSEKGLDGELRTAHELIAHAEDTRERLAEAERLKPDTDRMIALYSATRLMRDALEQASVAMVGNEVGLVSTMTTLAGPELVAAAGFSLSDQYTISVYEARPLTDGCRYGLHLIEHIRAIPCDKHEARVWPEGRGATGVAFSNSAEIIVDDLTTDTAKSVFGMPDLRRKYDDDRYLSMVAVPILVEGDDRPWGVVAATNDRIGHFNHTQEEGLKTQEAIRALAKYAALAVAMLRSRNRGQGPAPASAPLSGKVV